MILQRKEGQNGHLRQSFNEMLTIQEGFWTLQEGLFTNKTSIPVGISQKLTLQEGWPYISGSYKRAALYFSTRDKFN